MVVLMAEHSARNLMAKGGPATAAQGRVQYRGAGASTIPRRRGEYNTKRTTAAATAAAAAAPAAAAAFTTT